MFEILKIGVFNLLTSEILESAKAEEAFPFLTLG